MTKSVKLTNTHQTHQLQRPRMWSTQICHHRSDGKNQLHATLNQYFSHIDLIFIFRKPRKCLNLNLKIQISAIVTYIKAFVLEFSPKLQKLIDLVDNDLVSIEIQTLFLFQSRPLMLLYFNRVELLMTCQHHMATKSKVSPMPPMSIWARSFSTTYFMKYLLCARALSDKIRR